MKRKFADVLTIVNGKNQKKVENPKGEYPIYGSGGVMGHADAYLCEADTVVLGRKGNINNPIYVDRKFWNVDTAFGLAADRDVLLPKYLFYFCCRYDFERINKTVTIPSLTKKDLLDVEMEVPEIPEQQRIVDVLDRLHALKENRRRVLAMLDELVKARFVEMFGDPVCNNRGWNKYALKEKCKVITGNTPSRGEAQNYGDKIEWIKSDNIMKDGRLSTATEMLSDRGLTLGRAVEAGSILMTCIAGSLRSIGNVAVTNRKVAFNQQINAIVPGQQNPLFMYVQFLLSKTYLHQSVNMSLKGILSKGALENKKFIFPPVVIQNQFAAFVREVDQTKAAVRAQVVAMETLRAKMMQDFFG